jgi:hypothetical protein
MRAVPTLPLVLLLGLLLTPLGGAAQGSSPSGVASPLFADHEPLRLRIEADLRGLRGDRGSNPQEREGRLVVVAHDGSETPLPLKIRTRGNFRLKRGTCEFPPLRVNVPRGKVEGSVFEGQDKLKLVTHCRDRGAFEENTLEEYLIYRLYNVMTPASFRVRLARITYVDAEGREDPLERWGFLIESESALAERLGGTLTGLDGELVHPARMWGEDTGRVTLFNYLVGNTDFSMYYGHNVVAVEIGQSRVVPVPYDFDWSGLVNARYAKPAPEIGTRSVRQRVFRGVCRPDVDYLGHYQTLLGHREEMAALVQTQVGLSEAARQDALNYLNEAWSVFQDPDEARKKIERHCRQV